VAGSIPAWRTILKTDAMPAINLHSHTIHSDGCLLPSELAVRYCAAGYSTLAITDHVDISNIDSVVKSVVKFCRAWPKNSPIKVLPGVELTHLPLEQFKPLAKFARSHGIVIIVAHGETPAEPVLQGTNRAALEADIDILAHPGLITDADARLAQKAGVFLEITSRSGHNKTNSWVARQALKFDCRLVLDHDSHNPEDIISFAQTRAVGMKSGLTAARINQIYEELSTVFLKSKSQDRSK
jgi:histidinol phosphatase-like PHP family hydrolase